LSAEQSCLHLALNIDANQKGGIQRDPYRTDVERTVFMSVFLSCVGTGYNCISFRSFTNVLNLAVLED